MKCLLKTISALLVIVLPMIIILSIAILIPAQYSDTFVGALDEKFERLTSIDEEKIVVVGGSSVAFGLESELIEKYMRMPVVNFGLYAALGTKVMLDLSRKGINEGDIVILSPELDAQTLSLYFNAETVLQATDDDPSMLFHTDMANWGELASSMFSHVSKKCGYLKEGSPNPDGVYNSKNFNEYGDLEYTREENIMELYYDPNKIITLDESILDDGFFDYLNDYIRYCESRGATVYFSYCPMNSLALADGTTNESISDFESELESRLVCKIISYIDDYIMLPEYFYDTNFHLNDAGSLWRTIRLCEDMLLATDNPTLVTEPYPDAPELDTGMITVYEDIIGQEYFTYERLENGNYMITGLTDIGKEQKSLTIPLGVTLDGLGYAAAVTLVGQGAFIGTSATEIIIPENTYLTQMNNGAFSGASTVKALYIYKKDAETLNPPANFAGVAEGFVIHAPENSEYTTGYYWSQLKNVTIKLDIAD